MRRLLIGVLLACFFSIGSSCDEDGASRRSVAATGKPLPVSAVPEPSSILLGAAGALLIGFAIRRARR